MLTNFISSRKNLSSNSLNVTVASLRFLYKVTLGCQWDIEKIHFARREKKLLFVLSADEVVQFLNAVESKKYKAILMTAYAAGLRILETTLLKISNIDSKRMIIRVHQRKGKKYRYIILSTKVP